MLTFNISPCAFCIPMLFPELFFSVFLVASLSPLLPPRVYMFALGKGGNEGESCSELTVQDFSMAYLVVSQTVSLPSFKMWLSVLDISSLLHLMSLHDFYSVIFLSLKGCTLAWLVIVLIYIHFWSFLAYWHLITVVESSWKDSNMDSCSYHVRLGSTRTIPFLEGWVSLVRHERVSGITCGGVWVFIALVWIMIELQVWPNTKTSKSDFNDCKWSYNIRWICLNLLIKEPKSTVIHHA